MFKFKSNELHTRDNAAVNTYLCRRVTWQVTCPHAFTKYLYLFGRVCFWWFGSIVHYYSFVYSLKLCPASCNRAYIFLGDKLTWFKQWNPKQCLGAHTLIRRSFLIWGWILCKLLCISWDSATIHETLHRAPLAKKLWWKQLTFSVLSKQTAGPFR